MAPTVVHHFRRSCDVLVFNYPALLHPHNAVDELQPRPPQDIVWRLRRHEMAVHLLREPVPAVGEDLGPVTSSRDAVKRSHAAGSAIVRFDPHPWIDSNLPIWPATTTTRPLHMDPAPLTAGPLEVRTREVRLADTVHIGAPLATISWRRIANLDHSTSGQRLLLHKLKGLRLSGWDRDAQRRGCPHCADSGEGGGAVEHIMWTCSAAQLIFGLLQLFWQPLGLWTSATVDSASFRHAIVGLALPATPPRVWILLDRRHYSPPITAAVHAAMATVWQRHVLSCMQLIWRWRHGVGDPDDPWSATVATAALRGRLAAALMTTSSKLPLLGFPTTQRVGHLLMALRRQLDAPWPPPQVTTTPTSTVFLLFFDGGSRGNPGPGGSGAVVVSTNGHGGNPTVVWCAATSLAAATTTNNQAEYTGLVTGLSAAHERG